MNKTTELHAATFEPNKNPKKLVFLLHGYGDNAENFIPLARFLYDENSEINFFAPNAPSPVPGYPTGRQWFDLNPNGINFNEAGEYEKKLMIQDCLNSTKLIKKYIDNISLKNKLSYNDCFIIGFSQGSMMAFETGKFIDKVFSGFVMLSGRILPSENHNSKFFNKSPILIIHGDQDEVLKPKYFFESCEILKEYTFLFESHLIKGEAHTVSQEILDITKNFIKKNL